LSVVVLLLLVQGDPIAFDYLVVAIRIRQRISEHAKNLAS